MRNKKKNSIKLTYTIKIGGSLFKKINPEAISVLAFAETGHFSGNVNFRYKTSK